MTACSKALLLHAISMIPTKNKPTKQDVHGWIVLDKPSGITSAAAVACVKRITNCKKIGHGGTLDPLASGILPLALGEATKLFDYVVGEQKTYDFTVTWGESRNTDDSAGIVLQTSENRPTLASLEAILPEFVGIVLQVPPQFSAVKIDGARAYALARKGEDVQIAAREVEIFDLRITEHIENIATRFTMTCGKGTYVRSLARDLGNKLSCLGYISALRRTAVGAFTEKKAISLDYLEKVGHIPALTECVYSVESMLDDILALPVDSNQSAQLRQGRPVFMHRIELPENGSILALMHENHLVALGEVRGRVVQPVRVFNH